MPCIAPSSSPVPTPKCTTGTERVTASPAASVVAYSRSCTCASAFADADHYAEDLDALAARGASVEDAIRELTTEDVRRACDVFREVWQRTGGVDGRVSLEVDPGKAHDTEGTVAEIQADPRVQEVYLGRSVEGTSHA